MLIPLDQLVSKYHLQLHGVLHIGANTGQERFVYDQLGIHKQIWIEANPDIYVQLKENIAYNQNAIALNYLVGDENKPCVLHESNNEGQSSSILDFGVHATEHPTVHFVRDIPLMMHRIDSLQLDLAQVDLLNIDIQGAELMALKGMGNLLNQFQACYLEVNKDYCYQGCPLIGELDDYLLPFGFERVDTLFCGDLSWGDAFWIKNNA